MRWVLRLRRAECDDSFSQTRHAADPALRWVGLGVGLFSRNHQGAFAFRHHSFLILPTVVCELDDWRGSEITLSSQPERIAQHRFRQTPGYIRQQKAIAEEKYPGEYTGYISFEDNPFIEPRHVLILGHGIFLATEFNPLFIRIRFPSSIANALLAMLTSYVLLRLARRFLALPIDPTLCTQCGYDLRASPERCPECGRTPTGVDVASSRR